MAASGIMALGAMRTVRERGLRVPADVSVVGYDDWLLVAFTDPPLTTVWQSVGCLCDIAISCCRPRSAAGSLPAVVVLLVLQRALVRGLAAAD